MTDDEYAEYESRLAWIAELCARHIRTWGGIVGVSPDALAANVPAFQALDEPTRTRVAVKLTQMPSMAVTTHPVRWYRRDLAPKEAWSAAA